MAIKEVIVVKYNKEMFCLCKHTGCCFFKMCIRQHKKKEIFCIQFFVWIM